MFHLFNLFLAYPILLTVNTVILGLSVLGTIVLILLMIGFVNVVLFKEVYYPPNSDDLTGWADTFERNLGNNNLSDPIEIVEISEKGRIENPLSETTEKYNEIKLKLNQIREIWSEGYNYQTKEIKEIEPLIEGLDELKNFIRKYWNYFTADERIRLVTQANLLKWYHQSIQKLTFKRWLKILFSKRGPTLIRLFRKYYKNIKENPTNHVFIQLQNGNLELAELILDKAKQSFEKSQNSTSSNLTVSLSQIAYKTSAKLAEASGETIQTVLDKAIENYHRYIFLVQANQAFIALRQNEKLWLEELAERELWDLTMVDGEFG